MTHKGWEKTGWKRYENGEYCLMWWDINVTPPVKAGWFIGKTEKGNAFQKGPFPTMKKAIESLKK